MKKLKKNVSSCMLICFLHICIDFKLPYLSKVSIWCTNVTPTENFGFGAKKSAKYTIKSRSF